MTGGRKVIGALLIVAFLATAGMQHLARSQRDKLIPRRQAVSRLSGMDSFTLALLLGGLRGPLVMMLWPAIENQKASRDLEDIDTKIELIRLLQADFDAVHIFQMWNKAYNISVQVSSLPNKYATILDALDYGRDVLAEKPDDLNIVVEIGGVYLNKLGSGAGLPGEKQYYIDRVRNETLPHARPDRLLKGDPGWRRMRHDTMLDAAGLVLPELLAPRAPAALQAKGYDGSELQFLGRYNTPEMGGFPYGLSPLALAYNYDKRSDVLMLASRQQHMYQSPNTIDSRPAVTLRTWAMEEWSRGRRMELTAFGKPVPEERDDMERPTQGEPVNGRFVDGSEATRRNVREAIFDYRRTVQVANDAVVDYRRHMANQAYAYNANTFLSHIDECIAMATLAQADHDYLEAVALSNGIGGTKNIESLKKSAGEMYRKAIDQNYLLCLKYTFYDELLDEMLKQAIGPQASKATLSAVDPTLYPKLMERAMTLIKAKGIVESDTLDERATFLAHIERAKERLAQLTR